MNINYISLGLFSILFILSILMEFTNYKYLNLSENQRILWRVIMIIPLLLSIKFDNQAYCYLITGILILTLFSDIILLKNFKYGLISFAVIHAISIIAFNVLNKYFKIEPFLLILIISLLIGYCLYRLLDIKTIELSIMILSYLLIIILAVTTTINYSYLNKTKILLGIGYVLFFLCDYEVAWMNFKMRFNNDQIINNILYYGALSCFAISTWE